MTLMTHNDSWQNVTHHNTKMNVAIMHILESNILNMLSLMILNVILLNVVVLRVMAPMVGHDVVMKP